MENEFYSIGTDGRWQMVNFLGDNMKKKVLIYFLIIIFINVIIKNQEVAEGICVLFTLIYLSVCLIFHKNNKKDLKNGNVINLTYGAYSLYKKEEKKLKHLLDNNLIEKIKRVEETRRLKFTHLFLFIPISWIGNKNTYKYKIKTKDNNIFFILVDRKDKYVNILESLDF